MNKRRKKVFLSILLGTTIVSTTHVSCKIARNGYVSTIYNINSSSIVDDFETDKLFNNSIDNERLLFKYPAFFSRSIDSDITTPVYDEMVPQGLTVMGDYILTTSYDHSKEKNSTVYVLDKTGNMINECMLDIKSHVGGIAYDKKNKLVWIPSNSGLLNAYRANDFLVNQEVNAIYKDLNVGNELLDYQNPLKRSVAYLTIKDDDLYVGSFSLSRFGVVKKYSINVDGETNVISLRFEKKFNVPTRVQGLSFYSKDDKDYILFSRSFGRTRPSLLQICSYDENIVDYNNCESVSYEAPAMMEQISIEDGRLYAIFESSAKSYRGCNDELDEICVMNTDELILPLTQKRY